MALAQVGLSSLADLLLSPLSGVLMDRLGRKYSGIPAIFTMSVAFAASRCASPLLCSVPATLSVLRAALCSRLPRRLWASAQRSPTRQHESCRSMPLRT